MNHSRSQLRRLLAVATTIALVGVVAASAPARAASLKDVANKFKEQLFGAAKQCKNKITGLNLASIKGALGCLVTAVKNAGKTALVLLARVLYGQAVGFLRTNAPKAKAKLEELVNKVAGLVPALKNFAKPVIAAINTGSGKFFDGVAACEEKITSISLDTLKGVFSCALAALKGAGKAALSGLAVGLFDEFINLLRTSAPQAKAKLKQLADKLPFAAVKTLAGGVVNGIGAGSKKFVDEAASCRKHITGFNLDSAKNTFTCLKSAFSGALKVAGVEIVRNLWDSFVGLIKSNCAKAAGALGSIAGKLASFFPPAKGLASSIGGVLTQGCTGVVDKVNSLNPVK